MKHLLSAGGRTALAAVLAARPLLAFDFDGTLAPIVRRPDGARVSAAVARHLGRLSRIRPIAVVTGRAVADVEPRLGFEPRYIVGNHGAEYPGLATALDLTPLDDARARIAAHADEFRDAGIQVEDKRYSLTLHYRLAREQGRAEALIAAVLTGLGPGLRSFGGKCVFNVVIAAAPDKGDAVESLVQRAGCDSAVFVGDDVNDEAVFARARPGWLTVRVGSDRPETRAAYYLDGHGQVAGLLETMLDMLQTA